MKKIPSVFERDWNGDRSRVTPKPNEAAAWVLAGEGTATVKWDGTAVLVDADGVWGRYDCKKGKTPPEGFRPAMEPDPVTGHWAGWLRAETRPEMRWIMEACNNTMTLLGGLEFGTYEAIGPKINGNHHRQETHRLLRHGVDVLPDAPRDFERLHTYLGLRIIEGIVWHHPDGRMAKIKRSDFGHKWPAEVKP